VTPAALLQADGWAVAYPGAGTPIGDAAALAAKLSARPLCLSTTLVDEASLPLRRSPNGTALVVGGSASTPGLAARPGADCAAGGAVQAVVEPRRLSAA
jgi:methanogenic corrinoid protein MtbC1